MGSTKKLNESQKNEIRIYAETNSDELYDNSSAERWVGKENLDDLQDYPNKLYLLEGIIDDERLSKLENGEDPTKAHILPSISENIKKMSQCIIHRRQTESRFNDHILG